MLITLYEYNEVIYLGRNQVMANILIVDDSRTSRKMLTGILESAGHKIVGEASDGKAGVEQYKALQPDLVTMDITMPVLDGIAALQEIMEYDKSAKIIMVTAAGQKSKMVEAVKFGASDFLSKPFDQDMIISIIDNVLR
jgi:two-component system, chemotaxis family, chemotaxis protein CheY